MHCDDKRTIFALKQFISDCEIDLQESTNQLKTVRDKENRFQIQTRIDDLEKAIKDATDQLSLMK